MGSDALLDQYIFALYGIDGVGAVFGFVSIGPGDIDSAEGYAIRMLSFNAVSRSILYTCLLYTSDAADE